MDILKRQVAPISQEAWEEIDKTAKEAIVSMLSARRVLNVIGPKGWDYTAVPEGRLEEIKTGKVGEVCAGNYKLKNLTEVRVNFLVQKWELDNIQRGAEDIDLDALEDAAKKIALFEEEAILNGDEDSGIVGMTKAAGHTMKLGKDGNQILKAIGEGKYALFESYGEMPFDLIVSPDVYDRINIIFEGAHLLDIIKNIIGGQIIRSKVVDGAVLIPHKDEDLEFTVGQDFSVGYEYEEENQVRLFITESFTFRVLDGDKIVHYTI